MWILLYSSGKSLWVNDKKIFFLWIIFFLYPKTKIEKKFDQINRTHSLSDHRKSWNNVYQSIWYLCHWQRLLSILFCFWASKCSTQQPFFFDYYQTYVVCYGTTKYNQDPYVSGKIWIEFMFHVCNRLSIILFLFHVFFLFGIHFDP